METRNICWVGVGTRNYYSMSALLRDVLRLQVNFEEPTTIEFSTSYGDRVQLMAPGDPYFELFEQHARGPVPLFEVDDLANARRELIDAGIEIVGSVGRDREWEWLHFRAPDGNLYEVASRREHHGE